MDNSFFKTSPLAGPTPLRYSIGLFNMETIWLIKFYFSIDNCKYSKTSQPSDWGFNDLAQLINGITYNKYLKNQFFT